MDIDSFSLPHRLFLLYKYSLQFEYDSIFTTIFDGCLMFSQIVLFDQ